MQHLFLLVLSLVCCLKGSVVAIMGAEKNDGKFTVEDFCTADLPAQTPRKIPESDR